MFLKSSFCNPFLSESLNEFLLKYKFIVLPSSPEKNQQWTDLSQDPDSFILLKIKLKFSKLKKIEMRNVEAENFSTRTDIASRFINKSTTFPKL